MQRRLQDLAGGGAKNMFFRFGNLHVAMGFWGMLPRENFLKLCNLVRFGVYLDQILSLKCFQNYIHVEIHMINSCTHVLGSLGAYMLAALRKF